MKKTINSFPVDAVVTWVDGNDSDHKEKILHYIGGEAPMNSKEFSSRYDQINEIQFCIDSLIKFAPFLRKIFLITDAQKPEFISADDSLVYEKVIIIDHKEIFRGHHEHLPTFNSLSIETCIHRVSGLAEHFIYLNDDFFLINPTKEEDFFSGGLPILRGKWLNYDSDIFYKRKSKKRGGFKSLQQNSAKLVGSKRYFRSFHTPYPLRKSTLENFFKQNHEIFLNNIKSKFRSPDQFVPQVLANHIEIKNKTCCIESDLKLMYFRSYDKPLFWYALIIRFKSRSLFLGLQSLSNCPSKILSFILNWLNKVLY